MPSRDGKYHDNAVGILLEGWFKGNGWNFANGIKHPDDKTQSYGPPSINVRPYLSFLVDNSTKLTTDLGRQWYSLWTYPHIFALGSGQIYLQAAVKYQGDSFNPQWFEDDWGRG